MKRNRLALVSLLVLMGLMLLVSTAPAAQNLPLSFDPDAGPIMSSAPKGGGLPPPSDGGDPDDIGIGLPKPPLPPMPPMEPPPPPPPPPFAPDPGMPGGGDELPSFNWLLWLAMSLSW